ncbi:nucleolar complex-associated protein 3 [Eremomyces bilateralis CBS 781.70]|uniref:Nucleolar complex-associated protein 3 n=1 Tax=Eremomyces bilateralis CBS 781.70 TaxID=1392243 RepID=A0A6G1G3R1_9PEZI|nr:nucleolar complex-associated protein 3 [Eremomyces bilateralis CBS 781.70]KAF1812546.1 nucleolar complex-associated protein 3 [Eremomyces bilateralis CBS 781.70]
MSSRSTKRRRLNGAAKQSSKPTTHDSLPDELGDPSFSFATNLWNTEQDYEQRPRALKKKDKAARLPIRTDSGWVAQPNAEPASEGESSDLPDADEGVLTGSEDEETVPEEPKIPLKQLILQTKEELAKIASQINEDPDEHIGSLKPLAALGETDNVHVKRLVLVAQLSIYKDLIPGYRIRALTEAERKEKVTKDIRKLRAYEQSLMSGYKAYIDDLTRLSRSQAASDTPAGTLSAVAIHCSTILLVSVPHFNFRSELIRILTRKVAMMRQDAEWYKCIDAFEQLFREDEDGHQSFEAVQMLSKMIKGKFYAVHEEILNTFLHLRLLSEFSSKASNSRIDKEDDEGRIHGKKPRQKEVFRTKRERKVLKQQKTLDNEMKEADAAVSHEDRDKMQGETLKIVLGIYFRILKTRESRLMGAVLEGLARYAHLINQDFFGDILEVLRELIAQREALVAADDNEEDEEEKAVSSATVRNTTRESLLCSITAFALLEGQDASASASSLGLDLSFFVGHLYRTLYPVSLDADIEYSSKSFRLDDPGSETPSRPRKDKVNVQTTIVLLIRCLSSTLIPETALRSVPPVRIAAFVKQLLTISLQLPEKSALAMLGLGTQILKAHGRKIAPLWHTEERKGDGVFDPLKPELEASNPFASTVWEGEILRHHYCPAVREAVSGIEREAIASK